MRRITTAVVVLLAALVIAILAVSAAPGAGRPLYMNSHAGISARVNDLLSFYLIWAGIGLAMAAVLYEPAFAVIAVWFRQRRSLALTRPT